MKFIKSKKKVLIISGIASLTLVVLLILIAIFNKDVKLDEVKLRHNGENSGMFAIMLEQEDGVYELSTSKSWPQSFFKFNESKSGCQDKMGNKLNNSLEYSPFDNIVTLKTKSAVLCYLYFDRRVDVEINVETDGEANVLPTTLGYKKEIVCDGGSTPIWNYKYNRLDFSDVLGTSEKCSLKYTTDNSDYTTNYLNQMIMDMAVDGTTDGTNQQEGDVVHEVFYEVDYTNTEALPQGKYGYNETGKLDIYMGTTLTATEGDTASDILNFTDGEWVFDNEKLTTNKFYHISSKIQESGFYQFCYNIAAGATTNAIYVEVNGVRQKFGTLGLVRPTTTAGVEGCIELGRLNKDDHVKVIRRAVQNATYPFPAASFSLRESTSSTSVDTGYRYQGKTPNNYIWYNNELWRIIGVMDVELEDGSIQQLTKIMRNKPLDTTAWTIGSGTTNFLNSKIESVLVDSYLNSTTNSCNNNLNSSQSCNYTMSGLHGTNSYFGSMIQKVYWSLGGMSNSSSHENYYITGVKNWFIYEHRNLVYGTNPEKAVSYLGTISGSDYALSTKANINCARNQNLNAYNVDGCANNNWMYGRGDSWLITHNTNASNSVYYVSFIGQVASSTGSTNHSITPVLYLKDSVYVIEGKGSKSDPYIIAMK